jgi:protein-S-isoprenylcysteine O-methyltransferase Ste14
MFFYDRFFILGLVLLANLLLWSLYLVLRGRIEDPLGGRAWLPALLGGLMTLVGASGTFWCRQQMRDSWSAHTRLVANHRLIEHGPFAIVRHPIYAFAILMACGTVLTCPAWWNLVAGLGMVSLYVLKLSFEERMLARQLDGYEQYRTRVRYRLMPGVW